jgi:hypothetical protein
VLQFTVQFQQALVGNRRLILHHLNMIQQVFQGVADLFIRIETQTTHHTCDTAIEKCLARFCKDDRTAVFSTAR